MTKKSVVRIHCALLNLLLLASAGCAQSRSAADHKPLETIAALDVARYMGHWYEIARLPNWFQKKCVGDTSAEYRLESDGTVHVLNRCRVANGEFREAHGTAHQVGGPDSPKLKVRFAPAWLSWLPSVWGDYWVIDLDAEYQLVAISEPSRKYLWILARTPEVAPEALDPLLRRLQSQGFNLEPLQRTAQPTR